MVPKPTLSAWEWFVTVQLKFIMIGTCEMLCQPYFAISVHKMRKKIYIHQSLGSKSYYVHYLSITFTLKLLSWIIASFSRAKF